MNAILFPGQGSQIVGMGSEFFNSFDIVKKIFKEADEKLNFKISKIILEGPESDLTLTKNTQPAILVVSFSIFSVLKNEFNFNLNKTKFCAGHSLGEYSALVSTNSLSFNDALFLLYERGKSMQEAVPVGKGSMIAVLGSKIEELKKLISNHYKYTDSNIAKQLLDDWPTSLKNFVKVMPTDYKRVLEEINLRKQAV